MLKKYLKIHVTKGYGFVDYVPVSLTVIRHKAVLVLPNGQKHDVSRTHFSLAYNPVVIGLLAEHSTFLEGQDEATLMIYGENAGVPDARMNLRFCKTLSYGNEGGLVFLFHAHSSNLFQLNFAHRKLILIRRFISNRKAKKFFGSLSWALHCNYAALFSFPRRVVMITTVEGLSFPIDLFGRDKKKFFLGIRHSNEALISIHRSGRLVISFIPASAVERVYQLGKFSRVEEGGSPDSVILTEKWKVMVPDFVSGYAEVNVSGLDDIGSQCLIKAELVHEVYSGPEAQLHHLHLLEVLQTPGLERSTPALRNILT